MLQKSPTRVSPPPPRTGYAHPRCYAARLHDCGPGISREHFISRGLLQQIGLNKTTKIGGLRWQIPQTFNTVKDNSLASKVLCERHNNALSALDAQMIRFSDILEKFDNEVRDGTGPTHSICLFAGEDVERWLLKAMIGGISSRNITGSLPEHCVDLLYGISPWPAGTGLYLRATTGNTIYHSDSFQFQVTHIEQTGQVAIFDFVIRGLPLRLVLAEPAIRLENGIYRPRRLVFSRDTHARTLEMSWADPLLDATVPLFRQRSYDGPPPDWPAWARKR